MTHWAELDFIFAAILTSYEPVDEGVMAMIELLAIMAYILKGPVTSVIVVFGVSLNFITLYTLLKSSGRRLNARRLSDDVIMVHQKMRARPTIHTYFFWIAYTDSGLLVSAMLMYSVPAMLDKSYEAYVRLYPVYYMLSNATLTASVWLMCAMMYDRYQALCRPLHQRMKCQRTPRRRVHVNCVIVVLLALFYSLPRLLELSVTSAGGSLRVVQTPLVHNRLYMIGYRIVGGLLFYSLLPYIALSFVSTRVSIAVHSASCKRRMMSKLNHQSLRRLTSESERILLAIMSKFLISRLFPTALDILEHLIGPDAFLHSMAATAAVNISNLIVVISSATNFFIYYFLSNTFRVLFCA
ncbi:FMRFamide receptor [Toxocara canis]|uniref:FMRFamide receptor n=2 Tax=Toxocara canis TaxID=6265 RepID=A0A0B2W2E8_TOXCA|nr:FMRFamide receptor [Toxocara canis]VDM26654.1 unnamed protein product [Toxocara canis]